MHVSGSRSRAWIPLLQTYQGLAGLVLLLIVAWFLEKAFFNVENLQNVLIQTAIPGLMAIGMTFVIITGGIDLSVGSLLGLLNCVAASWMKNGATLQATIAYVLALGLLVGALNGLLIAMTKLQPFVVTLATMVSLRGIAYLYTNKANVSAGQEAFKPLQEAITGIPVPVWVLISATIVAAIFLSRSTFGRNVYAIGGNEEACRLSGVPVDRTRVIAYAVCGLCVAAAALLFSARTNNGQPSAGQGYELDAIAAAVVGGCSLMGGYGSVFGSIIGALFIACLNVLLVLVQVDQFVGMGFKGAVILVAVYLQNIGRR